MKLTLEQEHDLSIWLLGRLEQFDEFDDLEYAKTLISSVLSFLRRREASDNLQNELRLYLEDVFRMEFGVFFDDLFREITSLETIVTPPSSPATSNSSALLQACPSSQLRYDDSEIDGKAEGQEDNKAHEEISANEQPGHGNNTGSTPPQPQNAHRDSDHGPWHNNNSGGLQPSNHMFRAQFTQPYQITFTPLSNLLPIGSTPSQLDHSFNTAYHGDRGSSNYETGATAAIDNPYAYNAGSITSIPPMNHNNHPYARYRSNVRSRQQYRPQQARYQARRNPTWRYRSVIRRQAVVGCYLATELASRLKNLEGDLGDVRARLRNLERRRGRNNIGMDGAADDTRSNVGRNNYVLTNDESGIDVDPSLSNVPALSTHQLQPVGTQPQNRTNNSNNNTQADAVTQFSLQPSALPARTSTFRRPDIYLNRIRISRPHQPFTYDEADYLIHYIDENLPVVAEVKYIEVKSANHPPITSINAVGTGDEDDHRQEPEQNKRQPYTRRYNPEHEHEHEVDDEEDDNTTYDIILEFEKSWQATRVLNIHGTNRRPIEGLGVVDVERV